MAYSFNPFTGSLDVGGTPGIDDAPSDGGLYGRLSRSWNTHTKEDILNNESGPLLTLIINDNNTVTGVEGSIGSDAYNGRSELLGLYLGNSVTSIGSRAFYQCSGFTGSLSIPNSVTSIGSYAFYQCSGFTGSLSIPNSVTSIGSYAFYQCSGFTGSLTIPNSVTNINNYAFQSCSGFTGSLTIPNSVTNISNYAFYGCSGLTDAYLNQPLSSVGTHAFLSTGLTTVHLKPSPNTPAGWTIGSNKTIGSKTGVTVVADWTTYPN